MHPLTSTSLLPPPPSLVRHRCPTLPSMYDLPSEDPEEPGLPDEFHNTQPQLLRETFQPPRYSPDHFFVGGDLNVYYDLEHLAWHKRPDWFAVLGVPRLYDEQDLRMSYVIWQEQVAPYLVVELLSPGTEDEDLGRTQRPSVQQPPTKWMVYEEILRIPYYVVFSRATNVVQYFTLVDGHYQEAHPAGQRLWLPEAEVGLGLWLGAYQGVTRQWLRCYDADGQWIATPTERAEQEHARADREHQRAETERRRVTLASQRAETERQQALLERQRAERLAAQLRALGIEPDV